MSPDPRTALCERYGNANPTFLLPDTAWQRLLSGDANAAAPARELLVSQASDLLTLTPPSVMDKTTVPPTNSKHDYITLSIYVWPADPDGSSYVTRDGRVNPEADSSIYDRAPAEKMCDAVETLAYAYAATGDERFASKAADLLRVWFIDPATRMNPNMMYAQFVPGWVRIDTVFPTIYVPGAGGTGIAAKWSHRAGGLCMNWGGIIEAVKFLTVPAAAGILGASPAWTAADAAALRSWFADFVAWLRDSVHGRAEQYSPGNHGGWYWSYMAVFAAFAGMEDYAREILRDRIPARMAQQIGEDGYVTDVKRNRSFHYGVFTVTAFLNAAVLGDRLGVDLWSDGRLGKAIDWIASRIGPGKTWPFPNIEELHLALAVPLLATAGHRLGRADYLAEIESFSDIPADDRYRLLYP